MLDGLDYFLMKMADILAGLVCFATMLFAFIFVVLTIFRYW